MGPATAEPDTLCNVEVWEWDRCRDAELMLSCCGFARASGYDEPDVNSEARGPVSSDL